MNLFLKKGAAESSSAEEKTLQQMTSWLSDQNKNSLKDLLLEAKVVKFINDSEEIEDIDNHLDVLEDLGGLELLMSIYCTRGQNYCLEILLFIIL